MPATRSQARAHSNGVSEPSTSNKTLDAVEDDSHVDFGFHLSQLKRSWTKLQRESVVLRQENEQLKSTLDKLYESESQSIQPRKGKRGGPSNNTLRAQVRKLTVEVERLKMARKGDKRKIRRLKAREIKAEAQDLQLEGDDEQEDVTHKFRKLLREVEDLVTSNSYEESETCPICFEEFKLEKCKSLQCDHIFCDDCLKNMSLASGKRSVTCPTCREECEEEDFQHIKFSAKDQWDRLLAVVHVFAATDTRRGELDTTDEEIEEEEAANFIVDDGESERSLDVEPDPFDSEPTANKLEETLSTPPPSEIGARTETVETNSYANSPKAVKRKRLEELAQRKRKQ